MTDFSKMSDDELKAWSAPKSVGTDFSKMSDADLKAYKAPSSQNETSGIGDFLQSIPGGFVSGVANSASNLNNLVDLAAGKGNRLDYNQSMDLVNKYAPQPQPQGTAGKIGAEIGDLTSNPLNYAAVGAGKAGISALVNAIRGSGDAATLAKAAPVVKNILKNATNAGETSTLTAPIASAASHGGPESSYDWFKVIGGADLATEATKYLLNHMFGGDK